MATVFKLPIELALLLYLSTVAIAQDRTQPSQPDDNNGLVGWQPNPTQRGTASILESCILTIVACTWTIQHPNIPKKKPATRLGRFLHHLKWMAATVLVPEFILALAIDEHLWVRNTWKELKRVNAKRSKRSRCCTFALEYEENYDWKKKHLYYANMGGFRINIMGDATDSQNKPTRIFPLTGKELIRYLNIKGPGPYEPPSVLARMWSKILKPVGASEASDSPGVPETSKTSEGSGAPGEPEPSEPVKAPISEAHIDRLVKREALAKAIALLQIFWILISAIARGCFHRPMSQLEIMTVAFAACAVATYIIRWNKPQNVEVWTDLANKHYDLRKFYEPHRFRDTMKRKSLNGPRKNRGPCFRNDTLRPYHISKLFLPILIICMVIIGSLHLIAWDFSFPSEVETIMWRVASVASAGIPLLLLICSYAPRLFIWERCCGFGTKKHDIRQKADDFKKHCRWTLDFVKLEAQRPDSDQSLKNLMGKLDKIQEKLKEPADKPESYHDIFTIPVLESMIDFFNKNWNMPETNRPPDRFLIHLERLYDYLTRKGDFEQEILISHDEKAYRTDTFPHETAKSRSRKMGDKILLGSIYIVTIFYTLARLIIIAVAFSSLREMPAGVYQTTFAEYLPRLE
ncbi:uncharacterized protein F4812DRAFT_429839 [Daldinia caldariorum]|uniref:uncharacterized protein n=1 Tax=Daldinia caldariorum TaxID=326644 RepID=UPI002007B594|nr:uncharacterized protein F4812DRAFT_429839 [Daldinia caldariorum]KAI1467513.1 hypothetical protein F4812DRAFT_429839 [Daldinia caldariorum]